jgi:signal transduction histidine kinase
VLRARLEPLADLAIAAAVLLLSLLPLLYAKDCGCDPAPTWGFVLVVAQAVPLIWRRRWPFTVGMTSGLLCLTYGLSSLPDPPVAYAGLVALYSTAAYATKALSRLAGAIAAVSIGVAMIVDWPTADVQDVAVNYLLFTTAWLLGDSAATRRIRAAELEERVDQAERARTAEAERAVVEERNRIAREMHDIVAHHVSLMVVQAEAGPVVVERDPARAVQSFDDISATGKRALVEMRRLLGVLRDDDRGERTPQPGADQIPLLVESVRAAGLPVELELTGTPRPLPPTVDLSAYRLLQEALTNASRHAGPAAVRVRVHYGEDGIDLQVVDDGIGSVSVPPRWGGQGLVAMRERVALVGGTLEVGPRPTGGWSVSAHLPSADVPRSSDSVLP